MGWSFIADPAAVPIVFDSSDNSGVITIDGNNASKALIVLSSSGASLADPTNVAITGKRLDLEVYQSAAPAKSLIFGGSLFRLSSPYTAARSQGQIDRLSFEYVNSLSGSDINRLVEVERMLAPPLGGKLYLELTATDLLAADAKVYHTVAPIDGIITKMWSILGGSGLATGDATLSAKVGAATVTGGMITITQSGSGIGDVDSATPSANNTVVPGDLVSITVGGSNTANTATARVVVEVSFPVSAPPASSQLSLELDVALDSVADPTYRTIAPVSGFVTRIWSALESNTLTADVTLTAKINNSTSITGGVINIAHPGSIGDVDSAAPTYNNALTAGQVLSVSVASSNTNLATAKIGFEMTVLEPSSTSEFCLTVFVADLRSGGVYSTVAPIAGTITKIWSVTDKHTTNGSTDATLTASIGGTNITGGVISIPHGTGRGTVGSATPTANNVVAAGNKISITVGGGNTDTTVVARVLVQISYPLAIA